MRQQLEKIFNDAVSDIEKVVSTDDIEEVKLKYLSRKGELNSIKKNLKDLPDEEKKVIGSFANEVTEKLENSIKEKFDSVYRKELNEKLQKEKIRYHLTGKIYSAREGSSLNRDNK